MNKQKQYRLAPLIWLSLVLLLTGLLPPLLIGAETDPPADDQATAKTEEPQATSADVESDTQQEPQATTQTPATTAPVSKPLKDFKPSEEIGADSAVSFPIDI